MAYTKKDWQAGVTPLSEANMDHLETQYDEAIADLATHAALITGVHGAGASTLAIIASGSYTGNDTENRAIAHGLGRTPKFVFIRNSGFAGKFLLIDGLDDIVYENGANSEVYAVTAKDTTNFYVGNAPDYGSTANNTGKTYFWVAIG